MNTTEDTSIPGVIAGPTNAGLAMAQPTVQSSAQPAVRDAQPTRADAKETKPERQLVGLLFSVSRKPSGEYWPVYEGANVIGRDPACDIRLAEATVSRQHARLVVKRSKKTNKLIAAIGDLGSTEGTMVNEEALDFEMKICKSGDKLTCGKCYQLVFMPFDVKEMGLTQAPGFKAIEDAAPQIPAQPQQQPMAQPAQYTQQTQYPQQAQYQPQQYAPTYTQPQCPNLPPSFTPPSDFKPKQRVQQNASDTRTIALDDYKPNEQGDTSV